MAQNNREACIKATLQWEGGYTNDEGDHGGPTNWGITIADAQKFWKKNATAADVKTMPLDIAVDIYRSKYWKTPQYDCDKLGAGVDLVVFDFGVNSGPARAKQYLLASAGGTDIETINKICDARAAFLERIAQNPGQDKFRTGWLNRVKSIRKTALAMAKAPSPVKPEDHAAVIIGGGTAYVAYTWWDQIKDLLMYGACVGAFLLAGYILIKYLRKNQ